MEPKTNIIWVGSRQSDISSTDRLFSSSITMYGDNGPDNVSICGKHGVRADNNNFDRLCAEFFAEELGRAAEDEAVRFMFYDQSWLAMIDSADTLRDRVLCANDTSVFNCLSSKTELYRRYRDLVPMQDARILSPLQCSYSSLCDEFGVEGCRFVVQNPVSSGGHGTFVMDSENESQVRALLGDIEECLVSIYKPNNIPVNMHAVIFDNETVLYPGSVQLLRLDGCRIIYRGADYITYNAIEQSAASRFREYVATLCEAVRATGYRGVCGFDGMIVGDDIYIVEMNARFQGSTAILNRALAENGIRSIQHANLAAFEGKEPEEADRRAQDIRVGYSCVSFSGSYEPFVRHLAEAAAEEINCVFCETDGFDLAHSVSEGSHLVRLTFNTTISGLSPDAGVFHHENVFEPDEFIYNKVLEGDKLALKLTVMTQGIFISRETLKYLETHGGIRPGNNNAADICVNDMIINAPRDVKFVRMSPYTVELSDDNTLVLCYYGSFVCQVKLFPLDKLSTKVTKAHGIPYSSISYLSTDRLRVHTTNQCIFKLYNQSCAFCNIQMEEGVIPMEDIEEVISDYVENSPAVRHFLIGGQSAESANVRSRIIDVIRIVRSKTDKSIYVMALPYEKPVIREMCEAGMNELACNMEIYDSELALRYMPGKGSIPRDRYFDVLSYASTMLGTDGQVKSAFIAGLEPHESLIEGIRRAAEHSIEPIISVFRPLPETPLADMMAPPLRYLYDLYHQAQKICTDNGLRLGPSCVCCQNNTLSLPEEGSVFDVADYI